MKEIEIALDAKSINKAIKDLAKCKKQVNNKAEVLRHSIAELIQAEAEKRFGQSTYDVDKYTGNGLVPEISVHWEDEGNSTLVVASGEEVAFIEFGAGIHFNGSGSPHPKGQELGMTIGSYGVGNGKRDMWVYVDSEGKHFTVGTPGTAPLYKALYEATGDIAQIAKEIFNSD